jgi:hypothetical protein
MWPHCLQIVAKEDKFMAGLQEAYMCLLIVRNFFIKKNMDLVRNMETLRPKSFFV